MGDVCPPCTPADLVQGADSDLKGDGFPWHVAIEDGVDSGACLMRLEGWVGSSIVATNERRLFTWFGRYVSSVVMSVVENVTISVSILRINVHRLIIPDNVHRLKR
jgi:hypothetical protein